MILNQLPIFTNVWFIIRKKRKQLEVKNEPVANPIKLLRVNSTSIQLFFYEFSKLNPIKLFYRWIFLVDFTSEFFTRKFHWKKIESYKKIILLVKFTCKKINPIKLRNLQVKINSLVSFKNRFLCNDTQISKLCFDLFNHYEPL